MYMSRRQNPLMINRVRVSTNTCDADDNDDDIDDDNDDGDDDNNDDGSTDSSDTGRDSNSR